MVKLKARKWIFILFALGCMVLIFYAAYRFNINPFHKVGETVDSFNGVKVYYNGGVAHTEKRNTAPDGYNIGISYQCVEFVKRYYYQKFRHKMPDAYGNAKDFFDDGLGDGQPNIKRGLIQYNNESNTKPRIEDIIIFSKSWLNPYGHIAIISEVTDNEVEIVQQNPGPFESSREKFPLKKMNDKWIIANDRVLGRLSLKH